MYFLRLFEAWKFERLKCSPTMKSLHIFGETNLRCISGMFGVIDISRAVIVLDVFPLYDGEDYLHLLCYNLCKESNSNFDLNALF